MKAQITSAIRLVAEETYTIPALALDNVIKQGMESQHGYAYVRPMKNYIHVMSCGAPCYTVMNAQLFSKSANMTVENPPFVAIKYKELAKVVSRVRDKHIKIHARILKTRDGMECQLSLNGMDAEAADLKREQVQSNIRDVAGVIGRVKDRRKKGIIMDVNWREFCIRLSEARPHKYVYLLPLADGLAIETRSGKREMLGIVRHMKARLKQGKPLDRRPCRVLHFALSRAACAWPIKTLTIIYEPCQTLSLFCNIPDVLKMTVDVTASSNREIHAKDIY